jgi:hypothetical protein
MLAFQEQGSWDPVWPKQVGEARNKHLDDLHWLTNPYFFPSIIGLVEKGFAEFVCPDGTPQDELIKRANAGGIKLPIRFTPLGLSRMLLRRLP